MKNEEIRKRAEAQSLSRTGTAILKGVKLGVEWLPLESNQLGYTSGSIHPTVHVAWYNKEFFDPIEETERTMLRMGVFAHETLHQCFTAFKETNLMCEKMTRAEASIFMKFANTLEDPAIEYFAPRVMGGRLLDALHFSIKHIYRMSPAIDDSPSAFAQLINALIHFGDMGVIKGHFTFPEAKEYFEKVAPIYNKGIVCPVAVERLKYAKECMEITRPLWEEEVKNEEALRKLLEELMEALEKSGLHLFEDREEEIEGDEDSEVSERRDKAVKSMGGMPKDSEKSEDKSESGKGKGQKAEDEAEDDGKSMGSSSGSDSSEDSSDSDSDSDSESSSADSGSSSDKTGDNTSTGKASEKSSYESSEDEANELADESYEIDDATLDKIEAMIKEEEDRIERADKENGLSNDGNLPEFTINSTAFKKASCANKYAQNIPNARVSELYAQATAKYSREIKNLSKSLEELFKSDMEQENRTTSGSYNIMRGSIGTTARMFDKRRDPANLKDAEICLCVDLSGSMSCADRIGQARKAAIIFAEALTKNKIPYYVMGFSADRGADAVHTHFVDWTNKKHQRESLITMQAGGNNFDGYSIRYAAELLKSKPASNKVLFVISDGEPACCTYSSYDDGISDTVNAIKEARKAGITVFGIAVGSGCSPNVLQSMYGRDFIHTSEAGLTQLLGKKLKKTLKRD